MNGSTKLPPGWATNTDVAAVVEEIKARLNRLQALDLQLVRSYTMNIKEREFIHAYLEQLIKTGHS